MRREREVLDEKILSSSREREKGLNIKLILDFTKPDYQTRAVILSLHCISFHFNPRKKKNIRNFFFF